MREYIKLPKIIGILTAILAVFYIIRNISYSEVYIGVSYLLLFTYILAIMNKRNKQYKEKTKQTGKRWKLEEMIFSAGNGGFIMLNFFQIAYHLNILEAKHYAVQMLSATVLVFVALFIYISTKILPEKAETLLREAYPEYELSE